MGYKLLNINDMSKSQFFRRFNQVCRAAYDYNKSNPSVKVNVEIGFTKPKEAHNISIYVHELDENGHSIRCTAHFMDKFEQNKINEFFNILN